MTGSRVGILYTTSGDWAAVIWRGHLYDPTGEWIGYLIGRDVYSMDGDYMGYVSDDRRVLRKRVVEHEGRRDAGPIPPRPSGRPPLPATIPLPPRMKEIGFDTVDMFEEFPERFKQVSNTRQDMD